MARGEDASMSDEQPFTHLTSSGDVHMVDVSAKEVTTREAVATAASPCRTRSGMPSFRATSPRATLSPQ